MTRPFLIFLLLLLPPSGFISAAGKDPDSAEVQKQAQEALSRAKVLTVQGKVSAVQGKALGITGLSTGIAGTLKDLGARVTKQEITIELSADVMFDFNKYDLRSEAAAALQKVVQVIQSYPNAPILIEGHTDSIGTAEYNLKLSAERAGSVKNWLVQKGGVSASRISTKGWGATKPVAPNAKADGSDDPEGRQKNRRVEIKIKTG